MCRKVIAVVLLGLAALCVAQASEPANVEAPRVVGFDHAQAGQPPQGFTVGEGKWLIHVDEDAPSTPNTLGQDATSDGPAFNIILADEIKLRDADLTVRMKAVSGETDQGGGLVWRAKDAKNYYVCRFNPLEDNYRVYKVVDGRRTQLGTADVKSTAGWHLLRAVVKGDRFRCFLDGKELLSVQDATFGEAGRIGLWTKADARTRFDDLSIGAVSE